MTTKQIHIDPGWTFRDEAGNTLEPQLFSLLQAIFEHKKLTLAAKAAGISYRHAWNLLQKWSGFFGTDLVTMSRGRGAELTLLGEKLLWAEQRVMARFQPQMANIASELNLEIHKAMAGVSPVLRIQASHGYAVALLPKALSEIQLDLQYSSPVEALSALNRGSCDIAGFHLPTQVSIPAVNEHYQRLLKPRAHKIIRFISRQQGLMIKADNPCGIHGLNDLVPKENSEMQPAAVWPRFINRQEDSGTRALFDQLLLDQGLSHEAINGYNNREYTHSAVAAYVAAGMADVGFGVEEAAHKFGLQFIPLCREDYLFVCHQKKLKQAVVENFVTALSAPSFKKNIEQLAGYSAHDCGQIVDVATVLD
ncbi:substrate-binding domain-containing protein [Pseudomaricurvus hydrocarbonicus]|uniref:substrate-binding domain-containing protein n=1 Tax=Pseudomaricurvus hydrocarbonicus TaxID=1470433 RepID=UPI00312C9897